MKAKDFLINDPSINTGFIASEMWPTNRSAKTYMSRKLNGERPWTEKDEDKAKEVLNHLADRIKEVVK